MSQGESQGLVGRNIGPYRIVRRLGQGATGFVYEAVEFEENLTVALKLFAGIVDPLGRDRFLQEARLASRVQHPHLVRIFDAGESDGKLYIAYELMDPKDLEQVLGERLYLPAAEGVGVARDVASGLAALHAAEIVHRDVKPANIFRRPSTGEWVLGDLGIAKDRSGHSLRTGSGIMVGTPEYMAPEYVLGDAALEASDQYSLGVVLFELVAGRLPFEGADAEALFQRIQREDPDLSVLPDHPGLRAVVGRMLDRRPEKRYGSLREVADALAGITGLEACPAPPAANRTLVRGDTLGRRRRERSSTQRTRLALVRGLGRDPALWGTVAALAAAGALLWFMQ